MPPGREPTRDNPRDRQPGGSPAPPVKQPKPKKRKPNPLAGLPGVIDPATGSVTTVEDRLGVSPKKQKQRKQTAEIRRRQGILRAAGYNIVQDGIWGPRSQKAWNDYLQRGKNILKPDRRNNVAIADIGTPREKTPTKQDVAAQKRQEHFERARAAERERAATRAAILDRAAQLRRSPQLAAQMSLRDLTDVLVDREAAFNPAKSESASRAIQYHLRANGFDVPVTGKFDPRTYEALQRAFKVEQRREVQRQADFVRTTVYRAYAKGDSPRWYGFGKLPAPEEFVRQLQAGDFRSDAIWRGILAEMERNPQFAWEGVKQQQLFEITETLQPFGAAATLGRLLGPEGVPAWQYFADIASIQDVMPFGDYDRAGFTESQRLEHLKERAKNKDIISANFRNRSEVVTRAKLLLRSTDAEDFKKTYAAFMAVEDQKFKRFQQSLASNKTWWGDTLDKLTAPGDFFRTSMWYTGMEINQTLGLHRLGVGEGADRDIRWEDALVFGGTNPEDLPVAYDGMVEGSLHPALRFGYELTVDPLNFATPFRAVSSAARYGSVLALGKSTMGGYVLTGKGLSKAVVYQRGSWTKMGLARNGIDRLPLGVRDNEFTRRAYEGARRLTQAKDEALGAISKRLETASRLGWKRPKNLAPGEAYKLPSVKSGKIQKLLDETDEEMTKLILELPQLKPLLLSLKRRHASLWVGASMAGPKSQYGAALTAHFAESARPMAAFHVAADVAVGRYRMALSQGLGQRAAQEAAQLEYERIMSGIGTFLRGGDSKALGAVEHHVFEGDAFVETVTRNVTEEVERRVSRALDDLDRIYLPQIQRWLSGEADAVFDGMKANAAKASASTDGLLDEAVEHPLWDENFKWRGRGQQDDLVDSIRRSFDEADLIPNQRFGVAHTALEMSQVLERDIRIATSRLDDYYARNSAAGTLSDTFDYEATLGEEIDKLKLAWEKRSDGMWYDTRPKLSVSNLYTRHIDGLQKRRLTFNSTGEIDFLAVLGEAAPSGEWGAIERGVFDFAALVTRSVEKQTVVPGVSTRGLMGGDAVRHMQELGDAVIRRRFALREAEQSALRDELLKQGAVWRAFQHAHSRYARALYKGLNAQLVLWKFATLALRPAWAVRNIVDNAAKAIVAGVRDPRLFMIGPGKAIHSVFDLGLDKVGDVIRFCDGLFGTNVASHWDSIIRLVWDLPSDTLSKLFRAHNLEVPPEVFETGLRNDIWNDGLGLRLTSVGDDDLIRLGLKDAPGALGQAAAGARTVGARFAGVAWSIMGDVPENYFKRVIYRDTYSKSLKELADSGLSSVEIHLEATSRAVSKVEDTLFDYSKISVVEDNMRIFFPFIQFWRKNTRFWVNSFATKPWLNNAVLQFDDARRDAHGDLPVWMQRYFHTEEISDALAVVPGLSESFQLLGLGDGAQYDPMNMLSFAPFYRAFKTVVYGENELLPADRKGIAIIGPIIDALNDWGLGVSPFFRKPAEATGIASYRSWQTVFPQTSLLDAIGQATGHENLGRIGHSLERIAALGLPVTDTDAIAERFDYFVQQEIAGQVARGEEPDVAKAEQTVRDWFLVQNLWGYFGGIYWRRATPEDMYLAQLQDDLIQPGGLEWKPDAAGERKPNAREAKLLRLWSMRGWDRLTYERYLDLMPVIESYYRGDLDDKLEILERNPEIIRWTDGDYTGKPISSKFIRHAHRYQDQALFFDALDIAETLDLPHQLKKVAEDMFVSPEMRKTWQANDTRTEIRERMIAGEAHRHHQELMRGYQAIPETDFEARDAFLQDNPELIRYWNRNNDPADDYEAVMGSAKATLRDMYFDIVKTDGFEGGAEFLKAFPFMFEGTKSEGKIKDGEWIVGGGKWSAERQRDFHQAKPHLDWFFETFMKKVGEKQAWAWLNESETEAAGIVRSYLDKWGKSSQKRLDYMKAKSWLAIYFGMPPAERGAWLRGGSEGAKIVLSYFGKYGSGRGMTQHAKDYLATKGELDYYFSLSKAERQAFLKSGDPRADKVLDYFKKYGKGHQAERAFKKLLAKYPELKNGTPEQSRRLEFWRQFFELTPDERPAFVHANAERYGIFIYGEFGEEYRHDREQEYLRRAVALGVSERQSAYLYVKPLLDFYRTLDADEKIAFARANPEIQEYFDKYATKSLTGDKDLDAAVEEYFRLPPDSLARSDFLRKHPQVQDWFDKKNPAEGAIRNLLEQFFAIRSAGNREEFLIHHPELQAYFDRKKEERSYEAELGQAFDEADPRLRPFYEDAADLERAADRMRAKLRSAAIDSLSRDIETRRERRPAV